MNYIVFNKETNEVIYILDKEPIAVSNSLNIARCKTVPSGKKFIATNIQEEQEEYLERVKETVTLATGEEKEIIRAITKTKTYLTCELIAL